MRILIVEDEKRLNDMTAEYFRMKGYGTDSCYDGTDAMHYLDMAEYDAVILDVMLPGADGFEVLKYMRGNGNTAPVLMLTARGSVDDKVYGLDCGANDYLVKPFEFRELEARIRAITRSAAGKATNIYSFEDLEINVTAHRVKRAGKEIELSAREYSVLECLMRNQGHVLSREKIEGSVFGYDYMGGTNVVDVYIRYLRKKIDDDYERKLIQTVRGVGYVIK